jgi:hypothetical protein
MLPGVPEETIDEAPVVQLPAVTITEKRTLSGAEGEEPFFLGMSKKQTIIGGGLIVALAIAAFFYFKK